MRNLLERGADVNAPLEGLAGPSALLLTLTGPNGRALREPETPEERADAVEIVRLVAVRMPNFNILTKIGVTNYTALMLAADAGLADVVQILLDAGADPNFGNVGGYTPSTWPSTRGRCGAWCRPTIE